VATIYLHLIQNRYMFRSFTVLQCSHQHCVQPVANDVEVDDTTEVKASSVDVGDR